MFQLYETRAKSRTAAVPAYSAAKGLALWTRSVLQVDMRASIAEVQHQVTSLALSDNTGMFRVPGCSTGRHTLAFHEQLELCVDFGAEGLDVPSNRSGVTQISYG